MIVSLGPSPSRPRSPFLPDIGTLSLSVCYNVSLPTCFIGGRRCVMRAVCSPCTLYGYSRRCFFSCLSKGSLGAVVNVAVPENKFCVGCARASRRSASPPLSHLQKRGPWQRLRRPQVRHSSTASASSLPSLASTQCFHLPRLPLGLPPKSRRASIHQDRIRAF